MSRVSPLDYIFALGEIRSLEKFLIKEEVFAEAIEASLAEALRLFSEANLYSDELLHIKNSQQLETILNQELSNLKKFIRELILDKELLCLVEMESLAGVYSTCLSYKSEFLSDYLMYLVDMHNIKTFLRLYILGEPQDKLCPLLTCEGFLKRKDLLELYPQDLAAFLSRLEYVHRDNRTIDYAYHLGEAIQRTVKEKTFLYLEKAINDFLIQILKPAKYFTFGPEAILAYYFAKVNEINLIRMIILAKLNDVSSDSVKARLNIVYA